MAEMIADTRSFIAVPDAPLLGGGVIGVATVIDNPDPHTLMGAQFDTDACASVEEWTEWCTNNPVAAKVFDDAAEVITGDPFAVYAGIECTIQRIDEAKTRAEHRLAYGEGRGVDTHVLAELDAIATDLGGPFDINTAIGVAEAYAATVYGGPPTLLIPRQMVPCACGCGAILSLGGSLSTCQGSAVGNVTAPVAEPVTDTGDLYVTGRIVLLRGAVMSFSVPSQPAANGTYSPARALAERLYVPLYECFAAKVAVTCS